MFPRSVFATVIVLVAAGAALSGCSSSDNDASGGEQTSVTFAPSGDASTAELKQAAERILRRAADLNIDGARVHIASGKITVTARGNDEGRIAALGRTASLSFRPVLASAPASASGSASASATPSAPTGGTGTGTDDATQQKLAALTCEKSGASGSPSATATGAPPPAPPASASTAMCDDKGETKYYVGPSELTGRQVRSAKATLDAARSSGWFVQLKLSTDGATRFAGMSDRLSKQQPPNNQIAIALDGSVVSAPSVASRISGGEIEITGNFDRKDAEDLAAMVESGSLPVRLHVTSVTH